MEECFVEIRPFSEDENKVERMGPMPRQRAEKVKRGADINLDHSRYYTKIVPASDAA